MSESKNHIIQNGNPSDLTITIPKDQLSSDANNDQDDISNGKSLDDLKLQTFLTSNILIIFFLKICLCLRLLQAIIFTFFSQFR